jgi:hypothetical protein
MGLKELEVAVARDQIRNLVATYNNCVSRRGTIIEEGTYIDRYVKTAEGWRIAHRRVKMLFSVHIKD